MIEGIFGQDFRVIERALDVQMIRQQLLAANIANVDTPGYRALDVDFKESLRRVLEAEEAARAVAEEDGAVAPSFTADLKIVGIDGLLAGSSSANIELLLGRLGRNTLSYVMSADMISAKFRQLRETIDTLAR